MEKRYLKRGPQPASAWTGFRLDLFAGLTVAAVALPQAMAYALIAGIPPINGLYTAIVMTALGSLFGSSRYLINGPTNAISLVVFSAIASLGPLRGDPLQAVFLLSILVGGIQIVIALLKLGDLTRYVSESVIIGFMTGAGVLIALSQIPNLLGLPSAGEGHQHLLHRIWVSLDKGPINLFALGLGLGTAVAVVAIRSLERLFKLALPDMLLAILLATVVQALWGPAENQLKEVPSALPQFSIPHIDTDWLRPLSGSALSIALLGLLEALAIAKSIAARTREPLDYNRQCLAEGLANLGGGLFQCMPGSGSLSRSAINYQAGAYSRLSGIVAAVAVLIVLAALAPVAHFVPKSGLAGILLITAWRIIDRPRLRYCLKATRFDAGIALATAGVAVFLSIEFSILIGTFLSFLLYIPRAARLQASELTVTSDRLVRERLPTDPPCAKLVLFSLEGELFFGAAPELDEYLEDLSRRAAGGVRVIVLRLKRTRNPDMVCLERLQHFLQDMRTRKVEVLLCGVRPDFAQALNNLGFHDWLPPECVFLEEPTAGSATLAAVRRAYAILGDDLCPTCPRRQPPSAERDGWHYVI
jgi:SulP family sulfate permease